MSSEINPLISIIIPFYKKQDYLQECVRNCLDLNYPSYEILIISNSPLSFHSEKIKVIVIEEKGQGYKKNAGLAQAKGEICAFVDDDAYPDRNWLKNSVKYFEDSDVVAVGGPGVTPPNDSLMQKAGGFIFSSPIGAGKISRRYISAKEKCNEDELPGYNLLIRKQFLKEVGGIDVKFRSGEDSLISCKIIEQGKKFKYAPDVVVYHHRRSLFVDHLKQVSTYAMHRGYFAKKYPETSSKPLYLAPSILLLAFLTLIVLGIPFLIVRLSLVLLITTYFAVAFFSTLYSSKSAKLSIIVSIGIALTHIVYGICFIRGLFMKNLGDRASY